MGFSTIDYLVLILYLAGITVFGMRFKKSQRSVKDYFLGARNTSWIVICLSIVATETSTLTLIGVPALAYGTFPRQGRRVAQEAERGGRRRHGRAHPEQAAAQARALRGAAEPRPARLRRQPAAPVGADLVIHHTWLIRRTHVLRNASPKEGAE